MDIQVPFTVALVNLITGALFDYQVTASSREEAAALVYDAFGVDSVDIREIYAY